MSQSESQKISDNRNVTVEMVEGRQTPELNRTLSKEEKEKILLPGLLNEGHVSIDTVLQLGISIIKREDCALESLDYRCNRATSLDGGCTWDDYRKIDDLVDDIEVFVEVFGWILLPSGKIGMGWQESKVLPGRYTLKKTFWRLSGDEGQTWSEKICMNPTGEEGMPYHGDPIRLMSNGRLIVPVRTCVNGGTHLHSGPHGHWPEFDMSYVYYSDDEGKTWCRNEGTILGWLYQGWGNFVPTDEPNVDELMDGRLMMLARSSIGRLMQSFSEDGGEHWSLAEASPLCSSHSPCALKRIPKTGDLLCVWNQMSADEIRQGRNRCRLSAAITSDGKAWQHFRTIERHTMMNEADRIEPQELVIMCRAVDGVVLPPDYGYSGYPSITFHGDDVVLSYAHGKGVGKNLVSAMKIRVLPLEWFYTAI